MCSAGVIRTVWRAADSSEPSNLSNQATTVTPPGAATLPATAATASSGVVPTDSGNVAPGALRALQVSGGGFPAEIHAQPPPVFPDFRFDYGPILKALELQSL